MEELYPEEEDYSHLFDIVFDDIPEIVQMFEYQGFDIKATLFEIQNRAYKNKVSPQEFKKDITKLVLLYILRGTNLRR